MSEENKETTESSTGTNSNSGGSAANSQDIAKIVESRLAESRKEFEAKLKQTETAAVDKVKTTIISALNPESKEDKIDPLHEAFAKSPAEFIENIVEVTKEEVRKEFDKKAKIKEEVNTTLAPIYQEYPDLTKLPNEIYHELGKITDDNLPQAKRLEIAAKKVAERMGFKPKSSETQKTIMQETAMMPSGVSASIEYRDPRQQPAAKSLVASAADYVTGMRSKFSKVSGRVVNKE